MDLECKFAIYSFQPLFVFEYTVPHVHVYIRVSDVSVCFEYYTIALVKRRVLHIYTDALYKQNSPTIPETAYTAQRQDLEVLANVKPW